VSKHKGYHTRRFRDNPEEKRFAEAWAKMNDGSNNVNYLLDESHADQRFTPEAPERDCRIAATVIQWLGSPVGQGFLRDLGYERSETKDTEILWAAMTAMVKDIHAPQDQMTKAQWKRADALMARLDREMELQ
jgi:hypothetical protein